MISNDIESLERILRIKDAWRVNQSVILHAAGDFKDELIKVAKEIAAPGKGVLAADKSGFASIVENTEENRQAFRDLIFTAPDIEKHISGAIMFEDAVRN